MWICTYKCTHSAAADVASDSAEPLHHHGRRCEHARLYALQQHYDGKLGLQHTCMYVHNCGACVCIRTWRDFVLQHHDGVPVRAQGAFFARVQYAALTKPGVTMIAHTLYIIQSIQMLALLRHGIMTRMAS